MIAVWWNVERLFDPRGSRISRAMNMTESTGWTTLAYEQKIHNVASVLRSLARENPPALIGLGEVENDRVVQDLLKAVGWKNLVAAKDPTEKLDGYDVDLLYDKTVFDIVNPPRSYNIHQQYATRDILEVKLKSHTTDSELTVFVNHWPSRLVDNSLGLRIGLADYTARLVNRILKVDQEDIVPTTGAPQLPAHNRLEKQWNRAVLIMGDFNDEPYDLSITDILMATRYRKHVIRVPHFPKKRGESAIAQYLRMKVRLYNPTWNLLTPPTGPPGTSLFRGDWYLLDQIILSRGLLMGGGINHVDGSFRIHAPAKVPGIQGGEVMLLTQSGYPKRFDPKRKTGVSDHLPLVWELTTS